MEVVSSLQSPSMSWTQRLRGMQVEDEERPGGATTVVVCSEEPKLGSTSVGAVDSSETACLRKMRAVADDDDDDDTTLVKKLLHPWSCLAFSAIVFSNLDSCMFKEDRRCMTGLEGAAGVVAGEAMT